MNQQHYISLKNCFEFENHCAELSITAFNAAIEKKIFPGRFQLCKLLIADIPASLWYLLHRLTSVVANMIHIIITPLEEPEYLHLKKFSRLASLTTIQLFIPFCCTAIRLNATLLGFINPCWAIQGWKLAESGDSLSYLLWSDVFELFNPKHLNRQVCKPIYPSSARYYLGKKTVPKLLLKRDSYSSSIEKIVAGFNVLISSIANAKTSYFSKLLYYPTAISNEPLGHVGKAPYILSPRVKDLLGELEPSISELLKHNKAIALNDKDLKQLKLKGLYHLFQHIMINLREVFLHPKEKINLDRVVVEGQLANLQDLFFKLKFGCAHYPHPLNDISCLSFIFVQDKN